METQTQEKPQGMGDALKGAPAAEVQAIVTPAVETKTEAAPAAKAPIETATATPPAVETRVPLKAVQSERAKRQEAERQLAESRAELERMRGNEPTTPVAPARDQRLENRLLTISEQSARAAHADYDEKLAAFSKKAFDENGNPTRLYTDVMDESDHPGEAAYVAGKMILIQEKYGTDPEAMIKAVQAETEKDLEAKLRVKITEELTGKIALKNKNPTDILAGGASAGREQISSAPLGLASVLAKRKRR